MQARELMRYVGARGLPFTVFELGNEPNACLVITFNDHLIVIVA